MRVRVLPRAQPHHPPLRRIPRRVVRREVRDRRAYERAGRSHQWLPRQYGDPRSVGRSPPPPPIRRALRARYVGRQVVLISGTARQRPSRQTCERGLSSAMQWPMPSPKVSIPCARHSPIRLFRSRNQPTIPRLFHSEISRRLVDSAFGDFIREFADRLALEPVVVEITQHQRDVRLAQHARAGRGQPACESERRS